MQAGYRTAVYSSPHLVDFEERLRLQGQNVTADALAQAFARVEAARTAGIPVSVCGEMAGHAAATEMLVGIGIHELSVSPPLLLELKHRIRSVSHADCVELVKQISQCNTTTEVYAVLGSLQSWRDGGESSV